MTDQQVPKEKAAAATTATANPAPSEQNTCANHDSTPPAESRVPAQGRDVPIPALGRDVPIPAQGRDVPIPAQGRDLAVIDVQKLFWSGVWQLFRDRAKAQVALESTREQAQAAVAAAEAAVVAAEAERKVVEPRLQADVERLAALALAGVLNESDHAALETSVNEQAGDVKAQAGRMLGLAKGRLTRTRNRAADAADAAESELAEIQERLDLLEMADPDLYRLVTAAWESRELRIAADRAARGGDTEQASALLTQALAINPETEENARFYRRTREAIARAEKKLERERQIAFLKDRIRKAVAGGSGSALNAIEKDSRAAGVHDQIAGDLEGARETARRIAAARARATQQRAAAVAQALERNGGKGQAAVVHIPGQIRVFTRNGKGFVLTETHTLKGKDNWVRREEPGAVVVSNIPVNGVVVRV